MQENIKLVILFATCVHIAMGASLQEELLQYLISVIQYYQQQKPGWFKCVFYDLSAGSDNGWYENLLSSPQLDNVVKYVFDENLFVTDKTLPLKQDLAVIHVGNRDLSSSKCPFYVKRFFTFLDSNSPLLVLLDAGNFLVKQSIGSLLATLEFDKVAYIGTKSRMVIQLGLFGKPGRVAVRFPHPKDLIRSNIRNSYGRPIGYTHTISPWYVARHWLRQTASFLNTSLKYYPDVCTSATPAVECVRRLFMATHVDISIDHRDTPGVTPTFCRLIFSVFPINRVILVPQGRPFNAVEMFTKPLAWEAWIVFLLTLISIIAINLIYPTLFSNDPILLAVCGFGRYNLHHACTKEKLLLLPMIVFFFLLFMAYETKMIAFMADKPSIGNIKTLDELAKSGLKITADLIIDKGLVNDSLIGPQMVHKPVGPDDENLDGVHAHLNTDFMASVIVSSIQNYDFKLNRPKYVIIDQRKQIMIVHFWIGVRSPLAETFYYTQKVFFESGLFNQWQKQLKDFNSAKNRKKYMWIKVDGSKMLSFDDLESTWTVLTIGMVASAVAFCLECLLKYLSQFSVNQFPKNVQLHYHWFYQRFL